MPFGIAPALFDGSIGVVVGTVLLAAEVGEVSRSWASEDWPTTDGEIEETGVVTTSMGTGSIGYTPMVRYHYRVGDRQYVSDRIAFGGTFSSSIRGLASGVAERYGKRRTVTVHVSPEDPNQAVLEPGVHWTCWFMIAGGAVCLAVGLVGIASYFGLISTSIQFR